MGKRIEILGSVFLLWCILILTVPLNWLFAALVAAAVHELFHAAAIYITGGHICRFRIGVLGAELETDIPGIKEEFFCAMAGPFGSFLLLCVCRYFPRVAICGLVQGAYNLLPIYPLDGGRGLLDILRICCPAYAESIAKAVGYLTAGMLVLIGFSASMRYSLGALPFLTSVFPLVKLRLRKRPCKQRKIRVQ